MFLGTIKTGGAIGTDSIAEKICLEEEVDYKVISFKDHKTQAKKENIVIMTQKQLDSVRPFLVKVSTILGRTFPSKDHYVNNLLLRDYFIVNGTNAVIAFTYMDENFGVSGGTAWGICIATLLMKPILVYNLRTKQWVKRLYIRDSDKKVKARWEILLDNNFIDISQQKSVAIIGTRDVYEKDIQVIEEYIRELLRR